MYRIGIDLGGTNIAVGLVNEKYQIVSKDSAPTMARERTAEEIADKMVELCRGVCQSAGVLLSDVEAIGVACPGAVDTTKGVVGYCNNFSFEYFPVVELLRAKTGIQNVHAENDANAAAWGEAIAGAARGTKGSVMVTLGTGVGGGVIIDGKLLSGSNFAGGELGHMVIEQGGAPCTCGRRGCWEAYSSATALIRMTKEKMEECRHMGRKTRMDELSQKRGKVNGRTAFDAMRAGDAAAREVVDTYISYLACGITNMINIFRPEVICVGGGISGEGEALLAPLVPLVNKEKYGGEIPPDTKVVIAELGNDAGIIGAAFLGA
ncbi:MAG: ROK family protein [Clostridia bacterium]|nr:ROK family protein [Clostridia bacterium]MBR7112113.1 ROK family protein [Clostridia bacterium]